MNDGVLSSMKTRNSTTRRIIIGLDGVPYGLIKNLAESGVMPNMKRIIRGGVFKRMASSIPEVSSVAWTVPNGKRGILAML